MRKYQLYIDGQFVDFVSGETFQSLNPATEEPIAEVARANREDAKRAIAAARRAFDEGPWSRTTPADRSKFLLQIAEALGARAAEMAALETEDSGGTIRKTMGDLGLAAMQLMTFAEMGASFPYVENLPDQAIPGPAKNYVYREPFGVCGQIIPWNFPLVMAIWKLGPALATGNTVVLKPAPDSPCTAMELAKILAEIDLPKGVVNIIPGFGPDCGEELATNPLVDKVAFTGSTAVGRRIMQLASGTVKKVTLELGGKSPAVLLDDADLDMASVGVLWGVFFHQGQACESGTRLLVSERIHDEFVDRLVKRAKTLRVGDPGSIESDIGPLIAERQRERVEGYIRSGQEEGAKLVIGGGRPGHLPKGYYVEPTIFTNVRNDMKIAQEEIFGPVLCVLKYKDVDDAIRLANDTIYGLAGAVWSRHEDKAVAVARRIRAGTIWINEHHMLSAATPFGGYKQSGIGRELGTYGLSEYLQVKHVYVDQVGELSQKFWYQSLFGEGL